MICASGRGRGHRGWGHRCPGRLCKDDSVRFAFKTAPQNTTWRDMLAVWQEADDIELFESGWTFDHFYPIFSDSAGPAWRAG